MTAAVALVRARVRRAHRRPSAPARAVVLPEPSVRRLREQAQASFFVHPPQWW